MPIPIVHRISVKSSPKLDWGFLDVELEAETARPLPAGLPNQILILIGNKGKTQPVETGRRDLPACLDGVDVRPVRRVYRCRTDDRGVPIRNRENIFPKALQRIAQVPRELPNDKWPPGKLSGARRRSLATGLKSRVAEMQDRLDRLQARASVPIQR